MIKKSRLFIASLIFIFSSFFAFSQEALKSQEEEYYDFLSLNGITERPTLNYRTLSDSVWEINANDDESEETPAPNFHTWEKLNLGKKRTLWQPETKSKNGYLRGVPQGVFLKIYGPEWFNSVNTTSPYGQNDGALWQGRGYNTSLTSGARLEGYGVEITVKPQLSFSQNAAFDLIYNEFIKSTHAYPNEYSYFWAGNIDLPQRFGDSAFWTFDLGDTEIRYSWHTITMGFGNQAIWLGPAWLNPMLGSNNSPTFPKFDIGLRKQRVVIPKLGWYLGDIEGRAWVGQLTESSYFDNDSSNDKRQLTGFAVAYSPSFIPGFTIGVNKICANRWDNFSIKYLNPFYNTNNPTIGEDQKMSFTIDWIFPKVGFEVYGEIGKDDYSTQKLANPFHTVIYTLGAKKTFKIWKKHGIYGELLFEWSNFESSQDFQMQWTYMGYYAHGLIPQGYTQRGQIIGAGTGYFGNSQYLGFRVYYPRGNVLLYLHRHSPDNNYIYELTVGTSYSKNNTPDIYNEYWAQFRTYRTIGGEILYYITKSFSMNFSFAGIWLNWPYYTRAVIGEHNFHITLSGKLSL